MDVCDNGHRSLSEVPLSLPLMCRMSTSCISADKPKQCIDGSVHVFRVGLGAANAKCVQVSVYTVYIYIYMWALVLLQEGWKQELFPYLALLVSAMPSYHDIYRKGTSLEELCNA